MLGSSGQFLDFDNSIQSVRDKITKIRYAYVHDRDRQRGAQISTEHPHEAQLNKFDRILLALHELPKSTNSANTYYSPLMSSLDNLVPDMSRYLDSLIKVQESPDKAKVDTQELENEYRTQKRTLLEMQYRRILTHDFSKTDSASHKINNEFKASTILDHLLEAFNDLRSTIYTEIEGGVHLVQESIGVLRNMGKYLHEEQYNLEVGSKFGRARYAFRSVWQEGDQT